MNEWMNDDDDMVNLTAVFVPLRMSKLIKWNVKNLWNRNRKFDTWLPWLSYTNRKENGKLKRPKTYGGELKILPRHSLNITWHSECAIESRSFSFSPRDSDSATRNVPFATKIYDHKSYSNRATWTCDQEIGSSFE